MKIWTWLLIGCPCSTIVSMVEPGRTVDIFMDNDGQTWTICWSNVDSVNYFELVAYCVGSMVLALLMSQIPHTGCILKFLWSNLDISNYWWSKMDIIVLVAHDTNYRSNGLTLTQCLCYNQSQINAFFVNFPWISCSVINSISTW